jgi:hypothetical protein
MCILTLIFICLAGAVINFIQWQVTHEIEGQKVNQKKEKD